MVFFEIIEILVLCLIFVVFLFQIIIPIWKGTVWFPFFRHEEIDLDSKLREARSELELLEEQKELEELQRKKSDETKTRI